MPPSSLGRRFAYVSQDVRYGFDHAFNAEVVPGVMEENMEDEIAIQVAGSFVFITCFRVVRVHAGPLEYLSVLLY